MTLQAGDLISHYEILELVASGGMAVVYKARDIRLKRLVALKMPKRAGIFSVRMMQEARLIASVSHPSVCHLLDIGEMKDACFLVLEYVQGETLTARLQRGVLPLSEAIEFAIAILHGVGAIHGRGLAHGDLKPANLMLTSSGPRILDFGLAKLLKETEANEDATASGGRQLWGTPGYMAPELLTGSSPTIVSDVFALGAVFYESIAGEPAFPGSSALARFAGSAQDPPPPLTGSRELVAVDRVLRRAMAKTPSARFGSAFEFAEELAEAGKSLGGVRRRRPAASILVLPFQSVSPHPDSEFLAEALPDAISSDLSSYRTLNVCPSALGKRYPTSAFDWNAVSAETSVDIVVTGTLALTNTEVSLSVQILKIPEGMVIDAANHQSSRRDLLALQDNAVREIVSAVERYCGGVGPRLEGSHPRSESYDIYLRANLAAQDARGIPDACELYAQYVRLDPDYAPAWARLGRCYRLLAKYYGQPHRNMKQGWAALEKALSLNASLPLAQSNQAQHEADEGRPIEALVRLLRIREAAPNAAEVCVGLTYACRLCGLYAQSLEFHRAARKLEPSITTSVTHTYFQAGQYVQCLETYSGRGIGYIEPLALDGLGMHDEAVSRATENLARSKAVAIGALYVSSVHALWSGDTERARRDIETAEQNYFLGPEERYYFARKRIYGNIEGGLEQLASAVRHGFYGHRALLRDPWLARVRDSGAFQRILEECEAGSRRAIEAFAREAKSLQS